MVYKIFFLFIYIFSIYGCSSIGLSKIDSTIPDKKAEKKPSDRIQNNIPFTKEVTKKDNQTPMKHSDFIFNVRKTSTLNSNEMLFFAHNQFNSNELLIQHDSDLHSDSITRMVVSSKGTVITASKDKTINEYDLSSGKKIRTILGEISHDSGEISAIALSPDEQYLAVSGNFLDDSPMHARIDRELDINERTSSVIRIYNFNTGSLQAVLSSNVRNVVDLQFTPDGSYLFHTQTNGEISKWKVADFRGKNVSRPSFRELFMSEGYLKKYEITPIRLYLNKIIPSSQNKIYGMNNTCTEISWYKGDSPGYIENSTVTTKDISSYFVMKSVGTFTDFDINNNDIAMMTSLGQLVIYDKSFKRTPTKQLITAKFETVFNESYDIVRYSKNGRYLFLGKKLQNSMEARILDSANTYKEINTIKLPFSMNTIAFIDDENIVISHSDFTFSKINILGKKDYVSLTKNTRSKIKNIFLKNSLLKIEFTREKKNLVFDLNTMYFSNKIFDTKTLVSPISKLTWKLESPHSLLLIDDGFLVKKLKKSEQQGSIFTDAIVFKNYLITGGENGVILVYNSSGKKLAKMYAGASTISRLFIDYEKEQMISLGVNNDVFLWNLSLLRVFDKEKKDENDELTPEWQNFIQSKQNVKNNIELQLESYAQFLIMHTQRQLIKYRNHNPLVQLWHTPGYEADPYIVTILPLIQMAFSEDGFFVWTAEGYFSSSHGLEKRFSYHKNEGSMKEAIRIPMDKLYDHFFRPDLVKLKLQGEDISKYTGGVTYKEVLKNLPPTVSIASVNGSAMSATDKKANLATPTAKLSFNVTENNGGSGLIRIYQEGKLVKTIGSGQVNRQSADADVKVQEAQIDKKSKEAQTIYLAKVEDTVTKSLGREFNTNELVETVTIDNGSAISTKGTHTIEIPLKAGNNTISIEAFNKSNTVASYRDSVNINASIQPKEPKIYAIALGVNEFEQSSVSPLKYSENDAKVIAEKIKKATSYQTDVTLLTGANMTKDNIQKALQSIKAKAGLEDKVIFYVSTHGKAVNGNLFLVPQNNKSVKNWINFEELFKEVQSISALDQIFVIDACESGKASDIMASVYDAKASVLAKQSGVHVLMATTKGTFAFEHPDKNVQHGVFTYNILKALDDPKTDKNADKWISVVELSKTLQEPANNAEHQFPIIRNVGQDTQIRNLK